MRSKDGFSENLCLSLSYLGTLMAESCKIPAITNQSTSRGPLGTKVRSDIFRVNRVVTRTQCTTRVKDLLTNRTVVSRNWTKPLLWCLNLTNFQHWQCWWVQF